MTNPACPICQQAGLQPMIEFDDIPVTGIYPVAADARVSIRRLEFGYCPHCAGVMQLPGRLPPMDYTHIDRPTARQLPSYVDAIVERIATVGRSGSLVIEVGCNDGDLLTRLRRAGCTALLGIEPSAHLAALAQASGHTVEALPLTAANAGTFNHRYGLADAVVCRHTLEHVRSPRRFLNALRMLLKPGGHLAIEVPSLAPIIERMHVHELWDEHVSYFLPGNLTALLQASGFEQVGVTIERLRDSDSIVCAARAGESRAADFSADAATVARCAGFRDVWQARSTQLQRTVAELPRPVVALGASHPQANFLNFSGIASTVDVAIDDDPFKVGKYLPLLNHNAPILPSAMLAEKSAGGTVLLTSFGYPDWMNEARRTVAGSAIVLDVRPESLSDEGSFAQ